MTVRMGPSLRVIYPNDRRYLIGRPGAMPSAAATIAFGGPAVPEWVDRAMRGVVDEYSP